MSIEVKIRVMKYEDLEDIIKIDTAVLGWARPDYWEMKVELADKRAMASLVAETGGQVIGFVLCDATGWEYGVPETVGLIDTIGVLPEYRKMGVARMLVGELITSLRKVGVDKVQTMVDWRSWDLLKFFRSVGFIKGQMINLELDLN